MRVRPHLLLALAALAGCSRTPQPAAPPKIVGAVRRAVPPPQPVALSLEAVPATARALVYLGPSIFSGPQRWLRSRPAMQQELREHLLRTLGVDLTSITAAVAWVTSLTPPPSFAAFLSLRGGGAPRGKSLGEHRGVSLFAHQGGRLVLARLPGGLLVGTPDEVKLGIDRQKGAASALPADSPIVSLLPYPPRAEILVGVDASGVTAPPLQAAVQQFELKALAFTLEEQRLVFRLAGPREKLAGLKHLLMVGLHTAVQGAEQQKQKALAGAAVLEALGAIAGAHELAQLVAEVEPKIVGDLLLAEYRLPRLEELGPAFFIGIASAIAIPAFVKYLNRARAVEARESLAAIRRGAEAYHAERYRKSRAFRFPATTDWTPATSCCSSPGSTCPGGGFTDATWQTLQFQRSGPHRYQARFLSEGKGKTARFTVELRGDLDCDGTFSSYRVQGTINKEGKLEVGEPEVKDEYE